MRAPSSIRKELILVGGGHAHVQVLRRFAMAPPPETRLTVVLDQPVAAYSGMVPGFVAGQYRAAELEIDVVPLARRAGAAVVLAPAVGLDAAERRLQVEGRAPLRYDLISFDVGSTVAGLDVPGVREHAVATRPIGRFVQKVDAFVAQGGAGRRVVVVGAGAAGVELAFALRQRLGDAEVLLLERGPELLPGAPAALVRRVREAAARRGIAIRCGASVGAVTPREVRIEGADPVPAELVVWVTGAVSLFPFAAAGLPADGRGFVLVEPTLQVCGHPEIFAAGDCATPKARPDLPKAGVYAVRAGPVLVHNLRAALAGERLRAWRPQRDFLALLNLGDGGAAGSKWGRAFEGPWVMRLKDRIDRRFMRRFQVLDEAGALRIEDFAEMAPMSILCGGCAAKVGQSVLERALRRVGPGRADEAVVLGLEQPDDAAAVRTPRGEVLVSSVDAFRAFADDPWLVGRVAAVNSVSDLFAKGVRPRHALALVVVPDTGDPERMEELLYQVMAGARACLDPLGVTLLGGHTTTAPELVVGFSVEGIAEDAGALMRIGGLRAGQRLVLTKGLGTGVILHADMQGKVAGRTLAATLASLVRVNDAAAAVARAVGASACTDVTGFGLAGHLGEMARQSGVCARVDVGALPALPGAEALLARGLRSTFHDENRKARRGIVTAPQAERHPRYELLYDPQTSGGLVFGVDADRAQEAVARLHEAGDPAAAVIGEAAAPREDGAPLEITAPACS